MSVLLGIYKQPTDGLYHNPFNCYETHGFTLKRREQRRLTAENRPDSELSLSTWDKEKASLSTSWPFGTSWATTRCLNEMI